MNGRRRIAAVVIGAVAVLGALGLASQVIQPLAGDTCMTVYEDEHGAGDFWSLCSTTPSNVKVPNLGTHTEGLHSGCNRGINQSSSWSDCISSFRVGSLPANQAMHVYQSINYANQLLCVDANGSYLTEMNVPATNDKASSYRILGGDC